MTALLLSLILVGAAAQPAPDMISDEPPTARALPAFPGAEGFGAFARGGRGGEVYFVTNLEDYGDDEAPIEGSLRAAVEAEGPRTILFRVSGTIELERELEIRHPFLTIAGQSAPGDGIALKNYGIDVDASDVILRYLRVRPGDATGVELDAINIRSSNVILDHCSAGWATDETVSVVGDATNVTVQWCLISESLNESIHSKGEHGYGSLISTSGNVTIHHTAYVLHKSRNPRPRNALLDFRNNVIYGWGDRAGYNADDRTRMNYVGNYLHPLDYSGNDEYAFIVGGPDTRIYMHGNVLRGEETVRDDWAMIRPPEGIEDAETALGVELPFAVPSVTTHTAEEAFRMMLDDVGATRPRRDAADRRVIELMRAGEGRIIDSQDEVGGWPQLQGGAPPEDADRDGMADDWELRFGLNPEQTADHRGDLDGDGYTNLEEYLNDTDPTEAYGWVEPPVLRPSNGVAFTTPPLFVTVSPAQPGDPVYFTTDGSEPTLGSERYDGPIRVYDAAHVRAKTLIDHRPTTAAYAAYDRLEWVEPAEHAAGGLTYAVYVADDWDEGVRLDELSPIEKGPLDTITFSMRPPGEPNAVVFDGWLDIPSDGIYSFYFEDDVRSELHVGDRLIANGSPPGADPGRIALRQGLHRFQLRSLQEEHRASSLEWSGPNFDRRPISERYFKGHKDT